MKTVVLEQLIDALDLPDSAYEKAEKRYKDIGAWLEREQSNCSALSPHVFAQGSFRLGTAIKPLNEAAEYDLDLACKMRDGVTKESHTQEAVKRLLQQDIEAYRTYRGISAPVESKHRCVRLEYQDDLSFHMDIVPCIPATPPRRNLIKESMVKSGEDIDLASQVAELTVAITDDRRDGYGCICDDWLISNPEGYARWFESRMRQAQTFLMKRAEVLMEARVDNLPYYQWKTPLQRCVQLLKRHRDEMFKRNGESKPISVIITTLAGRSYTGESDIGDAMNTILDQMDTFISDTTPRVPNPVNPAEDFADRWSMPKYAHLRLEENFRTWLAAARADFENISGSDDSAFIMKQASQKLAVVLNENKLRTALGLTSAPNVRIPKEHNIDDASKPWRSDSGNGGQAVL